MLGKKLLTLACAAAIVGIGACFLPPPGPPLRRPPALAGVSILAIQVDDQSGGESFDSAAMSRETAANFNRLWKEYPIHARPWTSHTFADVTMHIVLLGKSVSIDHEAGGRHAWSFEITASYTLTARDGSVLGAPSERTIRFTQWLPAAPSPPSWNLRDVWNASAYNFAMLGGNVMFSDPSMQQRQVHP